MAGQVFFMAPHYYLNPHVSRYTIWCTCTCTLYTYKFLSVWTSRVNDCVCIMKLSKEIVVSFEVTILPTHSRCYMYRSVLSHSQNYVNCHPIFIFSQGYLTFWQDWQFALFKSYTTRKMQIKTSWILYIHKKLHVIRQLQVHMSNKAF